ncbi:sigma-70 family RNA polymerase sigma factor [Clostridium sp. MCC353]|uniref:RNA polymerase sigma factor n=1 Tax=Clostridium sp. MCC353 TaxID=2592646 RepID=UPI001C02718F|nr:sigma-70 family RNA polymerase sigma factor [Clostridium sp. MCC353]MBT9779008.1 sigma-70 family RNA polymerase sigma factor [Clostridium sp. MCC353]
MEDSKIVDLYWTRSERAITETARKYGNYCYAIAHNILSNAQDADESVNDTYLGAWNSMPPHRPSILRTFLGKITRRISLKKWRDKNRMKRGGGEVALALDELNECIPSGCSVEDEIIARELAGILNRFISELPEIERQVFLCRYWYLDSIEKISLEFNFSSSKVKSMLHRTRVKLRSYLRQEGAL